MHEKIAEEENKRIQAKISGQARKQGVSAQQDVLNSEEVL